MLDTHTYMLTDIHTYTHAHTHIHIHQIHTHTHQYTTELFITLTETLTLTLTLTLKPTHTCTVRTYCTSVNFIGQSSNVCVLSMDWTSFDGKGWLNLLDSDKVCEEGLSVFSTHSVMLCHVISCHVMSCVIALRKLFSKFYLSIHLNTLFFFFLRYYSVLNTLTFSLSLSPFFSFLFFSFFSFFFFLSFFSYLIFLPLF